MNRIAIAITLLSLALGACGTEATTPSLSGSRGVTQGGAQDIGRFRRIVEDGSVPAADTLDPVGFFAEHAVDLPPADCGEAVCIHPFLAVAPRFDGGNWTMAFLAMNSSIDPAALERPAAHTVIVAETSLQTVDHRSGMIDGLSAFVDAARPEDRLSLLTYGTDVEVHARAVAADDALLASGFEALDRTGGYDRRASLYDALVEAGRIATETEHDGATRILLLSSGLADAGISTPERIVALAESFARQRVAFGVVAFGHDVDDSALREIGDSGAGTFAFAADPGDLEQILTQEAQTTMFPLATDFRLEVRAAPGYRVGRIYGARRASAQSTHAWLSSPALFLGHRTGADDVSEGRRGGGGGLFVELIAEDDAPTDAGLPAFTATATYRNAAGEDVLLERTVVNSLPPGQNPDEMRPEFSDESLGKAFMMLNMYLALRTTLQIHEQGDCARALGTVDMFAPTVDLWQAIYPDPDILDDLRLLMAVRANVERACQPGTEPIPPRNVSMSCFFL